MCVCVCVVSPVPGVCFHSSLTPLCSVCIREQCVFVSESSVCVCQRAVCKRQSGVCACIGAVCLGQGAARVCVRERGVCVRVCVSESEVCVCQGARCVCVCVSGSGREHIYTIMMFLSRDAGTSCMRR